MYYIVQLCNLTDINQIVLSFHHVLIFGPGVNPGSHIFAFFPFASWVSSNLKHLLNHSGP